MKRYRSIFRALRRGHLEIVHDPVWVEGYFGHYALPLPRLVWTGTRLWRDYPL